MADSNPNIRYIFSIARRVTENPAEDSLTLGFIYSDSKKPARTCLDAKDIPDLVDKTLAEERRSSSHPRLTLSDRVETISRATENPLMQDAYEPVSGRQLLEFRRLYNERKDSKL